MKKAYLLEDYTEEEGITYDYSCAVVFAEDGNKAKKQVNKLRYDSVPEYIDCRRIPEYDQYNELGYVPPEVLYYDNFTLSCTNCGSEISTTVDYEEGDEDDEDCEPYDPQFVNDLAYCSQFCKEIHTEELLIKEKGFKLFNSIFQNVQIVYSYLTGDRVLAIHFNFPGGSYKVTWYGDKPTVVNVSLNDVEAWNKYRNE